MDKKYEIKMSPRDKEISEMYQSNYSYKEMVERLNIETPKIVKDAIQNVKKKIIRIDQASEKTEQLKLYLNEHSIVLNPTIEWCEIEEMTAEKEMEIPYEYMQFLTEIGNGGTIKEERIFPIEESLENIQNGWMPFCENKDRIIYYLGVGEKNQNFIRPKLHKANVETMNALDYIQNLIQLKLHE